MKLELNKKTLLWVIMFVVIAGVLLAIFFPNLQSKP